MVNHVSQHMESIHQTMSINTNKDCIECITSDLTSPRISATIVTSHVFNMSQSYCALRGIGAEGKARVHQIK